MKTPCYPFVLFLVLLSSLTIPQTAFAQLSGYTRGSYYGFGDQYTVSQAFGELALRADYAKDRTSLYADVRFLSGIRFDQKFSDMQLNEAYASYQGEKYDFHLGNQIVKWGRTDGINPTGNLISSDFFFLSPDPDDQISGTFMARLTYRIIPQIEVEVLTIPFYHPSQYRYDLFDFGDQATFSNPVLPAVTVENATIAGRMNVELPAMGFSVSGFRGYDPFYGFALLETDWSAGKPQIVYAAQPYKKTALGADVSIPVSRFIIRSEIAWNKTENYQENAFIPTPNVHFVAGLESQFFGVTAILQYVGKYALDYISLEEPELLDPTDPMQVLDYSNRLIQYETEQYNRNVFNLTEEFNHGISCTLSGSFGYELVQAELTGLYLVTTKEYMVRPKVTFRLSDGLHLAIGGSYMDGPNGSVFDYAGKILSGGFLELKASF